mmetsp:Transcript_63640/g.176493  ORF Transcript_63640/g.176493 Transcript_63640/m.176493 type:complete len:317 (-) Transcript_63640:951-1901(-)
MSSALREEPSAELPAWRLPSEAFACGAAPRAKPARESSSSSSSSLPASPTTAASHSSTPETPGEEARLPAERMPRGLSIAEPWAACIGCMGPGTPVPPPPSIRARMASHGSLASLAPPPAVLLPSPRGLLGLQVSSAFGSARSASNGSGGPGGSPTSTNSGAFGAVSTDPRSTAGSTPGSRAAPCHWSSGGTSSSGGSSGRFGSSGHSVPNGDGPFRKGTAWASRRARVLLRHEDAAGPLLEASEEQAASKYADARSASKEAGMVLLGSPQALPHALPQGRGDASPAVLPLEALALEVRPPTPRSCGCRTRPDRVA